VLIAAIALGNSYNGVLPTFTPPTGWALVRRTDHGTVCSMVIYVRVATATEPAGYTWTSDLPVEGVGWISGYVGVDNAAPIHADAGQDVAGSGSAYSTPGLTTTVANTMLVASFAGHSGGPSLWTTPPGMTVRANLNNADTRSGASDEAMQTAAGATGQKTTTASLTQDYALTHLLALKPR
jgi:hypothetical protein